MYKKFFILTIILFFLVIINCLCSKNIMNMQKLNKKLGGFQQIDINSNYSINAFAFLKQELKNQYPDINLIKIKESYLQIVAGYNVLLICEYNLKSDNKVKILQAKIYTDLNKVQKITELKMQ